MKTLNIRNCFDEVPKAIDYVLPGMIQGTVGALISPGGHGKSFLAMELAIQIASGADVLDWGQELKTGKVAYLAGEDPEVALHARLHHLGNYLSLCQKDEVIENLTIHPLIGDCPDLLAPQLEHGLVEVASGKRLVIIDTLRRFHTGNENDSGEMSKVITALERIANATGASILFLHHSSKSAAMGGTVDEQQSSRGSSVLVDNVRWQGFMSTMTKAEAKDLGVAHASRRSFVRFGVSKQNYGPPFVETWFTRVEGGVLRCVAGGVPRCVAGGVLSAHNHKECRKPPMNPRKRKVLDGH
jgi:RecA-family ATPase